MTMADEADAPRKVYVELTKGFEYRPVRRGRSSGGRAQATRTKIGSGGGKEGDIGRGHEGSEGSRAVGGAASSAVGGKDGGCGRRATAKGTSRSPHGGRPICQAAVRGGPRARAAVGRGVYSSRWRR